MIQNLRSCNQKDHENFQVMHFCTNYKCQTRWCCSECLKSSTHLHGKQDNRHIMQFTELIQNFKNNNQIQLRTKQNLQLLLKTLNVFDMLIANIKEEIIIAQNNLISYGDQLQIQEYIQQLESNYLNDQQFWRFYSKIQDSQKINLSCLQYHFENLQFQFYQFELLLKDCQMVKTTKLIDIEDLKKLNELNQQGKQKITQSKQARQDFMVNQSIQKVSYSSQRILTNSSILPSSSKKPIQEIKQIHLSQESQKDQKNKVSLEFEEDQRTQGIKLIQGDQEIQNINKIK